MIGTTAALVAGGLSAGGALGGAAISSNASRNAAKAQQEAAWNAIPGINNAVGNAQGAINTVVPQANELLKAVYEQQMTGLQPFQKAGSQGINALAAGLAPGGELSTPFQFEADPGYQHRLQEGMKIVNTTASARGGLLSGRAVKESQRFASGLASQEYGNAFDRFMQARQQRTNALTTLAGFGQDANSQALSAGSNYGNQAANNLIQGQVYAGNAGIQGAQAAGEMLTGAGNARASGYVGAGNAWNNALSSIGNTAQNLLLLNTLNRK